MKNMLYCRRKEEDEMNKADERILLEQITEAIRNAGYNPKMQIRGYLAECNDTYITRKGNARELIKTISTETLREYLKTE